MGEFQKFKNRKARNEKKRLLPRLQSLLSTQVWLADVETRLHKNVELKDSLQEKRTQLQTRLALLQDVTSRQRAVESLAEKGQVLRASCGPNPEVETFIANTQEKYQSLLQQAKVSWQLVKYFLGSQKTKSTKPFIPIISLPRRLCAIDHSSL